MFFKCQKNHKKYIVYVCYYYYFSWYVICGTCMIYMKNMIVIGDTDLVHRVSDLKQVSKFGP